MTIPHRYSLLDRALAEFAQRERRFGGVTAESNQNQGAA